MRTASILAVIIPGISGTIRSEGPAFHKAVQPAPLPSVSGTATSCTVRSSIPGQPLIRMKGWPISPIVVVTAFTMTREGNNRLSADSRAASIVKSRSTYKSASRCRSNSSTALTTTQCSSRIQGRSSSLGKKYDFHWPQIYNRINDDLCRMKKIINTPNAPAPIGPYSQAVQAGTLLFISGQIPINPQPECRGNRYRRRNAPGHAQPGSHSFGCRPGFRHVVKTTILLSDMSLFATVNEIYGGYFIGDFPARETYAVKGLAEECEHRDQYGRACIAAPGPGAIFSIHQAPSRSSRMPQSPFPDAPAHARR